MQQNRTLMENDIPSDWNNPNWEEFKNDRSKHVHEWKSYISQNLQDIWQTFTVEQKQIIAGNAQIIADNELWD